MKSPTSANQNMKIEDIVENELVATIGVHVSESARIIFNIKQALY